LVIFVAKTGKTMQKLQWKDVMEETRKFVQSSEKQIKKSEDRN
jgi:hypothetical protein